MKGYQIKITIKGSKPPIWRRVIVPEKISFYQLHQTVQQAFGWDNCHLHEFEFSTAGIRVADGADVDGADLFDWWECWSEKELIDHLVEEYPRFVYTYDFGDSWEHQILVEKTVEYSRRFPTVIKYKGDNLPEDCGGIWGYYDLLKRLETEPGDGELHRWAESRGMEAYDLNQVNRIMETNLVFKPGRKRIRQKSSTAKNGMEGFIEHFESQIEQLREMYDADSPQEIYRQYNKKELKRLAKLHHMAGYSDMQKSELIQNLAEHVQKKSVMERYFRCASDDEIRVFENAAALAGEAYDPGEGACQYLHYGGYYGLTDGGQVVVMPTVAQGYQDISTEKFHKCRKRTYLVWAYISAALYLYGVTADEEITALFNLYEKELLTVEELHAICGKVQGLRCNFKYKNGYFFELALKEDDGYLAVLGEREGKKAFIPSRKMVMEIAELGLSEPHRQLAPWIDYISSAEEDIDPLTSFEAAAIIHHMVRLGYKLQNVEKVLGEAGVLLETESDLRDFSEVFETIRKQTRMIANYGFTTEELASASGKRCILRRSS